jgi:hypothetical protein
VLNVVYVCGMNFLLFISLINAVYYELWKICIFFLNIAVSVLKGNLSETGQWSCLLELPHEYVSLHYSVQE